MTEAHRVHGARRPAFRLALGCLAIGWGAMSCAIARADRISIRGGGQLKGKLVTDPARPAQYLFYGETGKTPMVLKKEQVVQVTPESSALDEYVVKLRDPRTTAEAEAALATWCEDHLLPDLALVHHEAAVKRDSTFDLSHKKLGHVLMNGRWLDADEVKEAQGLIKDKGRWITPEEKERRDLMARMSAEGNRWLRRIKLLRDAYVGGSGELSRDAERRLLAIEEPSAVVPVLKVLGDDPIPALRILAAKVLGGIPGPEAASGMVGRLLYEENEDVRRATLEEVCRRDPSEVVPLLTRSLKSTHHELVNRAAWSLSRLNALAIVPRLVSVLVTVEYEVVTTDGGGGPGSGVSFNAVSPSPGFLPSTPSSGFAAPYGGSFPVLTPPAVGSGAVGFGAVASPYPGVGGASISSGGGAGRGPVSRLVPVEHRNGEVLAALVKLTGQDFGYDIPTWKRWVATSFKVESAPSRRVLEP